MSVDLQLFQNLLFISPPWLEKNVSDHKYQQLLQAVQVENYSYQPTLEIKFPAPLTPKTKYFYNLIKYESIRYLNALHKEVTNSLNENEKKYWVHKSLALQLKNKFVETEKIISSRLLYFSVIDNRKQERKIRDDAFIVQYLKHQLIHIFLEVQASYFIYWGEDELSESGIHSLYFSEDPQDTSFIGQAFNLNLPAPESAIINYSEKEKFNVIKNDIRDYNPRILGYADIIAKPDRFALAEQELFNSELLDLEYKFIKKWGNVEKMAALYHILIQKQHFKSHSFVNGRKQITDLEIRKFLNHHYIATIDREFRNFKEKSTLDKYLNNNIALPLLIPN